MTKPDASLVPGSSMLSQARYRSGERNGKSRSNDEIKIDDEHCPLAEFVALNMCGRRNSSGKRRSTYANALYVQEESYRVRVPTAKEWQCVIDVVEARRNAVVAEPVKKQYDAVKRSNWLRRQLNAIASTKK